MPAVDPLVIESCNTTWVFDASRSRFRRVPRGASIATPASPSEWSTYHSLEIDADSDAFVVSLNEDGTRRLRSFRHHDPCPQCGAQATAELSLDAITELP